MIKNKKIDLEKLAKETFSGTQVGVLIEDFDHKLDLVVETQQGIIERIDRMESKLDATFEAVGDIKMELTVMKDKDEELDKRVVVLERKVAI